MNTVFADQVWYRVTKNGNSFFCVGCTTLLVLHLLVFSCMPPAGANKMCNIKRRLRLVTGCFLLEVLVDVSGGRRSLQLLTVQHALLQHLKRLTATHDTLLTYHHWHVHMTLTRAHSETANLRQRSVNFSVVFATCQQRIRLGGSSFSQSGNGKESLNPILNPDPDQHQNRTTSKFGQV